MLFKKIFRKIKKIIKNAYTRMRARMLGIVFMEPNYLFKGAFTKESIIIDTGCGFDADFSIAMIERYNATSFGIDPTRKHQEALAELAEKSRGRFIPVALAVSGTNGAITFHESQENVSGSLYSDHRNITHDTVASYDVESVTLAELLRRLGLERANYLKLDLEGAEYGLVEKTDPKTYAAFDQILIEFHHDTVASYSRADTEHAISTLERSGFRHITFDGHSYLFFK